jgi:hypothetical protein
MANPELPCETQDAATPEATLRAVATECEFDATIAEEIVALKLRTLVGFKHAFTSEADTDVGLLSLCGEPGKERAQKARVRRAWFGVGAALLARAGRQGLQSADDMAAMLSAHELENLDELFWRRRKAFLAG